jgi:hypothetical protein
MNFVKEREFYDTAISRELSCGRDGAEGLKQVKELGIEKEPFAARSGSEWLGMGGGQGKEK